MICLRCGCEIQPGEPRAVVPTNAAFGLWSPWITEIEQHSHHDGCMVTLRRKEVELAAKRSEEHETQ